MYPKLSQTHNYQTFKRCEDVFYYHWDRPSSSFTSMLTNFVPILNDTRKLGFDLCGIAEIHTNNADRYHHLWAVDTTKDLFLWRQRLLLKKCERNSSDFVGVLNLLEIAEVSHRAEMTDRWQNNRGWLFMMIFDTWLWNKAEKEHQRGIMIMFLCGAVQWSML